MTMFKLQLIAVVLFWTNSLSAAVIKDVKLVNPAVAKNPTEGRLEIHYKDTWGSVCSAQFYDFSDVAARVVCASLGFGLVGKIVPNKYGAGVGPIWFDVVSCTGNEKHVINCSHSVGNIKKCDPKHVIAISCKSDPVLGDGVRLVNGKSTAKVGVNGRLEILYKGVWGTVCGDGFTDAAAEIVCKQIGLGPTGKFIKHRYGAGTGKIWLTDVKCTGKEIDLGACKHGGWGVAPKCKHSQDVSITCSTTCPTGFTHLLEDDICLKVAFKPMNWSTAGDYCRNLSPKSHTWPVGITRNTTQKAIEEYLKKEFLKKESKACIFGGDKEKTVWTAGQSLHPTVCTNSYVWKYARGIDEPFHYTNWFKGEPKCSARGIGDENCVYLRDDRKFKWSDIKCSHPNVCPLCMI